MIDLDPILSSVLLLPDCASFISSPGIEVRDFKLPVEWKESCLECWDVRAHPTLDRIGTTVMELSP
jgi:hypothetical protein